MSTKTKATSVTPPADSTPIGATPYAGAPIDASKTTSTSRAPTFLEVLNGMTSSSRLDAEATKYIDEIDRIFHDAHADITGIPITTDKIEARVYVHNASRYAFALLFAETFQSLDTATPPVTRIPSVNEALAARGESSIKIIQNIVVTKNDYALASKMAAFIINSFMVLSGSQAADLTVELLKNVKITAITAIDKVRQYVRDVSPHAIPDRDDIGVLLCLEVNSNDKNGYRREVELKPFLAITGYTRIMNTQNPAAGMRFVPVPTITNVISSIPNKALLAMALPLAADAFIVNQLWTRPYTTFRSGSPNLGNLITDPSSKKPLFTDTNETFISFRNQYMTNPYLAIDITEGRARPVGIDAMVGYPGIIISDINSFFKTQITTGVNNGQLMLFTNYTGSYVDKGVIKDTRCVDYLDLACKVQNVKEIEDLLLQPNQPQVRIERVRSIYPENTRSLYMTTTVVLDATAVRSMNDAMRHHEIQLSYDMPASGNINIGQFTNVPGGNSYEGFQSIGYGFGPQSYVPGMMNPYANIFGTR